MAEHNPVLGRSASLLIDQIPKWSRGTLTTFSVSWKLGAVKFAAVAALVEAGQVEEAAQLLRQTPVELIPCESLRPWIFHPDHNLRQLVIKVLGQKCDTASIVDLGRLFESGLDFYDHDYIFEAFASMGEPAVPALLSIVRDGTPGQRSCALQGLGQMGGPAVPCLVELLEAKEADELLFVALENSHDSRAVPALLKYLAAHPKSQEAADALAECSDESCGKHIPAMVQILNRSRRVEVSHSILQAIGNTRDPAAIVPLIGHLHDIEALEALGQIAHPEAVEVLAGALKLRLPPNLLEAVLSSILINPFSSDELRREAARICLSRRELSDALALLAGEPACQPVLEEVAQSPNPLQRLLLANALTVERAAPHYEFVSGCGDLELLRELASQGSRLPLGLAIHLSQHQDAGLRRRLAESMHFTGKSISVLMTLLRDKQARVREAAARALDQVDDAFPELAKLHSDRSRLVRSAAANSILGLRNVDIEVRIRALSRFLFDKTGRSVDLEVGTLIPSDGSDERPYLLSESIADLEHPLATEVLERWRAMRVETDV